MKICPTCKREFDDSEGFCKFDGTKLIHRDGETIVLSESEFTVHSSQPESFGEGVPSQRSQFSNGNSSWDKVKDYIMKNYKYKYDNKSDMLSLIFEINDDDSHIVFVESFESDGGTTEWLQFLSPVGEIGKNDIFDLLEELNGFVCGGAVKIGETVYIRNRLLMQSASAGAIDNFLDILPRVAFDLSQKYA